jgi:diadenylate cyclase
VSNRRQTRRIYRDGLLRKRWQQERRYAECMLRRCDALMIIIDMAPQHAIDFAVLIATVYLALRWASRARALRLCLAAIALSVCGLLAHRLGLVVTAWVFHVSAVIVALLILLLFPAEFRYALLRLDKALRGGRNHSKAAECAALAQSVFDLANTGVGLLMVLPRADALDGLTAAGTPVSIPISPETLASIFNVSSPLHDGAAVVQDDRIVAVKVVLPLTRRVDLPPHYGTRHRAALGLSEHCDALVVLASEETHAVRLSSGGSMTLCGSAKELEEVLRNELVPRYARQRLSTRIIRLMFGHARIKVTAIFLAAGLWYVFFVSTGIVVRRLTVPLEFTNIAAGRHIADQSSSRVEVEVRGSALLIDSIEPRSIVSHVPVGSSTTGTLTIRVTPESLNLQPGITVDRITPDRVSLKFEP